MVQWLLVRARSRFVFDWYCRHRVLHSFPTRRSSDLLIGGSLLPVAVNLQVGGAQNPKVTSGTQTWPQTTTAQGALGLDRKSTRLNSSHTVISYAVFCLKKKTSSLLPSLPPPRIALVL